MKKKSSVDLPVAIGRITCERLLNPMGVDTPRPRLGWILESARRGVRQTAYQVLVASEAELLVPGRADIWDSGRVESAQSVDVEYRGLDLASATAYRWMARIWDESGQATDWSRPGRWLTGLFHENQWQAKWITNAIPAHGSDHAPLLRKEFAVTRPVRSACALVSGLGFFDLRINGEKVGDRLLQPSFTHYDKRALYMTFAIADLLKAGGNTIGAMLGNGWYNQITEDVWRFHAAPWRDKPKLLCQIEIAYQDGSREVIVSDRSWKTDWSPIVSNGIRKGESYDARLEQDGWDRCGFNDAAWTPAIIVPGPGGRLVAEIAPPVRVVKTLEAIAIREVKPQTWLFDFGETVSGWGKLMVSGPAGTTVTMRYNDILAYDGDIDRYNNRTETLSVFQTDTYTLKGGGVEVWEPRFTYHGFRYAQMTGYPGIPTVETLKARVAYADFESAGSFACSKELLNRIQQATLRSFNTNFLGFPTDCPHREKIGWTGDALIAAETGLMNFHAEANYDRWLNDFADCQRPSGELPGYVPTPGTGWNWGNGPAWDSAYIFIPWYLYIYTGDRKVLDTHYEGMKRYLRYLGTMADRGVVDFGLGDWCPPRDQNDTIRTPRSLTSTGYYYADAVALAEIARILGKGEDAAWLDRVAATVREGLLREFHDPDTGKFAAGTQTAQACALFHPGLLPPAAAAKVLARLLEAVQACDNRLDCGILGAKYLFHVLADNGHAELAYRIAVQTTFPSYGWWIAQGATTLWEMWCGSSSRDHIMFGDISAWFYRALGGIRPSPAAPGFAAAIIRPSLTGDLTWVKASHDTPYGRIVSEWDRTGSALTLRVVVPHNASAVVFVPASRAETVLENGAPAAGEWTPGAAGGHGYMRVAVSSGKYEFASEVQAIA